MPEKLEILDEHGIPVAIFDPVHLTYPPDSVMVERRKLEVRMTMRALDPQEGTYFVCDKKPTKARFKIEYDVSDHDFWQYYSRASNSLSEDPLLFEKETGFLGSVAAVVWDGRDTSAAARFGVHGKGAKYWASVELTCCDETVPYYLGGSFEMARPNAAVIGNAYPQNFLDIVFKDEEAGEPKVLDGYTGLSEIAGTLEGIGPEFHGYDAGHFRNTKPDVVVGTWEASAVFAWFGHSFHGNYLVSYSGLANANVKESPGDMKKYAGVISPLVGWKYEDKDVRNARNGAYDFPASMDDCEFVLLAACWSARAMWPAEAKGKSLIDVCRDRGADVAIGWVDTCDSDKAKLFLKTLVDDQASVDSAGAHPSLDTSLDVALDKIGVPNNGKVVKILLGAGVDPKWIFFGDLPRYGRK